MKKTIRNSNNNSKCLNIINFNHEKRKRTRQRKCLKRKCYDFPELMKHTNPHIKTLNKYPAK